MPSKRHGYLTRKEWLAQRLEDARDRAGAYDVERLLRSLGPSYTDVGLGWPALLEVFVHAPENPNGLTYDMASHNVYVSYTLTPHKVLQLDGLLLHDDPDIEVDIE